MKKLIAIALAGAFSTSASAASIYGYGNDASITIYGDQIWMYHSIDGVTSTELDGDINFKASTTIDDISVSAGFNLNEAGSNDGGGNLTLKGGFGTLGLGDVNSAVDAIDDITDWGYSSAAPGSSTPDAAMNWLLPIPVSGLSVYVSHAADSNVDGNAASNGYAFKYTAGPMRVGYGIQDNDSGSKETLWNLQGKFAGATLGYESNVDTTAADVDTTTNSLGGKYTIDKVTFLYEKNKVESAGTTSKDITSLGLHYKVASPLTLFVETKTDDKNPTTDSTTMGVHYKF